MGGIVKRVAVVLLVASFGVWLLFDQVRAPARDPGVRADTLPASRNPVPLLRGRPREAGPQGEPRRRSVPLVGSGADAAAPTSAEARQDLEQLRRLRGSRVTNEDLIQYIDAVSDAYAHLEPPAGEDALAHAAFEKKKARFRADAEKLLLRCLTHAKIKEGRNLREEVRRAARKALARIRRK